MARRGDRLQLHQVGEGSAGGASACFSGVKPSGVPGLLVTGSSEAAFLARLFPLFFLFFGGFERGAPAGALSAPVPALSAPARWLSAPARASCASSVREVPASAASCASGPSPIDGGVVEDPGGAAAAMRKA